MYKAVFQEEESATEPHQVLHTWHKLQLCPKFRDKWKTNGYLGDIINSSGTMCHTKADRVAKGTKWCIINCFSEASDITMGVHQIKILVLLYNSMFIPTVLYSCEAWNNKHQGD